MSDATGSYIHIPPRQHVCPVPWVGDPVNTVWRCDTCLTYWRYVEQYVGFGTQKDWTTDFWRNFKAGNLTGWFNATRRPRSAT